MRLSELDLSDLADGERVLLAHELLQSVVTKPAPLSQAERDEIAARIAAIDSGAVTCDPWEVVHERLRRLVR